MDYSEILRERLAEYAHNAWTGWMTYLFHKCTKMPDGSISIPPHLVERWGMQMRTPYMGLTDEQAASDVKEAETIMLIVYKHLQEAEAQRKRMSDAKLDR